MAAAKLERRDVGYDFEANAQRVSADGLGEDVTAPGGVAPEQPSLQPSAKPAQATKVEEKVVPEEKDLSTTTAKSGAHVSEVGMFAQFENTDGQIEIAAMNTDV